MSHLVTIKAQFKNINTIRKVCKELNMKLVENSSTMFFGNKLSGHLIYLKSWERHPFAITKDGDIQIDNLIQCNDEDNEVTQFKNLYALYETENRLKQQHLNYRIVNNNPKESIKIEVML